MSKKKKDRKEVPKENEKHYLYGNSEEERTKYEVYSLLAEIGVPFSSAEEPLGIGWDD